LVVAQVDWIMVMRDLVPSAVLEENSVSPEEKK
jgi:hypothetical protein